MPTTGTGRSRSFSRYGSAPTWSSCPWVRTTACDVVGAVAHELHVGQHEVDPEHVRRRERQADVHDQQPPVDLETGHVAADLADASEEDETAVGLRQGDRRPPAPRGPWPPRRGWPATSGSRVPPQPRPSICSAALTGIGFDVMNMRVVQRGELLVDLARRRDVAGDDQVDHLMDLRPDEVARDAHDPDGARGTGSRTSPSRLPSRPRTRRAPRRSAARPPGSRRSSPSPRRCSDAPASSSSVSCSIRKAVRPGMLYSMTGSSVASATAEKCAVRPRCGGLL